MFVGVVDRFRTSGRAAFIRKVEGKYTGVDYSEVERQVEAVAVAFREMGLEKGDRVGIMSENRLEWVVTDFACTASGLVDVPVFPILTPKQVEYIFNDAEVKVVVCSNLLQFGKLLKVIDAIPTLRHVVVMNDDVFEREPKAAERGAIAFRSLVENGARLAAAVPGELRRMAAAVTPDDLLTLIYTSGTTGNPKGVMLTHANLVANLMGAAERFVIGEADLVLSYLPLCHAYERTTGYYTCFGCGAQIAFAESIDTVAENLSEVRPTVMTSVPRLFERIKARIERGVAEQSARDQRVFRWALRLGVKRFRRQVRGRSVGPILGIKLALADRLVFRKVRARTGGRMRLFVSGGAALPLDVAEFFFAVGLPIVEGYGMTESSPVISANPLDRPRPGTVGPPLYNVEVRLAEDGEILTRGPHVMRGYYHDPAATAEAIDADGWLHTGDIGAIDRDGYVRITDRKKHIIVNSGGKNIAPGPIEALLSESRLIDQIMLVGEKRPFCTALIVPDFEVAKEIVEMSGASVGLLKDAATRERLADNEVVLSAVDAEVKRLQRDLSAFERVRRFELLSEPFTVENGMMTPTLKVKRKEVATRYANEIERMYEVAEE